MVVKMLVGVLLLVHQQIWTSMGDDRMRSPMVDPLMRRSPLEKNFMRFGRSWSPPERSDDNSPELENVDNVLTRTARDKENFIRFGKSDMVRDNFLRFGRTKDNFMRFGRGKDSFMRFGRGKTDFMRFGRSEPLEKIQEALESLKEEKLRIGRSTSNNFMRFGRSPESESPGLDRNTLGNGFMRFGRDKILVRIGRHRLSDKGDGFIRFGRSLDTDPPDDGEKRVKRSYGSSSDEKSNHDEPKEMVFDTHFTDRASDYCGKEKNPNCVSSTSNICSSFHQPIYGNLPNVFVGPDLSFLSPFPKNKRAKSKRNFIRLG